MAPRSLFACAAPAVRALSLCCFGALFACGDSDKVVDAAVSTVDADAGSAAQDAAPQDPSEGPHGEPLVRVAAGLLLGKLSGSTRAFLGIPYAKPPVGALRFQPAEPAEPWSGMRQATEYGASCPQAAGMFAPMGPRSEDCLFLNVFTPAKPGRALPVMVFIHGGAFIGGGSGQYEGVNLSTAGGVVVVTLNYRLGALGFLGHDALDAGRGGVPSGNDGLRDQLLALGWVRDNIAAFGGDPDNVTLFGESAGSMSTCVQMVSPLSLKLAKRFIMESATCVAGLPIIDRAQSRKIGAELASALCAGKDVPACLRALPVDTILAWGADRGISGAGWGPVVNPDDPFLPEHPKALIAQGKFNRGGVIVGSNLREWGLFVLAGSSPPVTNVMDLEKAIDGQFGPAAAAVKAHYTPSATDESASAVFVRLMSDALFRCPARALARAVVAQGSPAYLYSFEEGTAFHAFEIPYVFGNPSALLAPTLVEPLRDAVQGYWTRFATTGDPNQAGGLAWPKYDPATDPHMTLRAMPAVGTQLSADDCNFWDALNAMK